MLQIYSGITSSPMGASKSSLGTSYEPFNCVCGPCKSDQLNKEAKYFCRDCEEHLCDVCHDAHRKLKATKNHKILTGTKLPRPTPAVQQQHCVVTCNQNREGDAAIESSNKTLLGMRFKSSSQHKVRVPDDENGPGITGCRFIPNGFLILCDRENDTIKLLDNTFTMKTSIYLESKPWDVSVIDDNNVIATLPDAKQLQFVQVFPQMKTGRVINLDIECYGVEVANNEIYISCHNETGMGEVRILDLNGNMKRQLGVEKNGSFQFVGPFYVTVNKSATKIYVSDFTDATITCLAVTGETVYEYKDDKLCSPEALFVDGGDNVVVCDEQSNNVQVITADGRKAETLLSSSDGIDGPYSIAFRDIDNMLVVSLDFYADNDLMCFKLSN